uniref:Uncharacterized protein n=1 Tax=Anguilla anguilla TaxID=7936 RepID=A0A0E9VQ66_ANGAN
MIHTVEKPFKNTQF